MNIAVIEAGLVTSLGYDLKNSCAALRAGITRRTEIHGIEQLDMDELESVPLLANPVQFLTEGYDLLGRWLRLAIAALQDLWLKRMQSKQIPIGSKLTLIAVTPRLDSPWLDINPDCSTNDVKNDYVGRLLQYTRFPLTLDKCFVVAEGCCGFAEALSQASDLMQSGEADEVIVLAVDSYLTPYSLEWFAEQERLCTQENIDGFYPGEAGVAISLKQQKELVWQDGNFPLITKINIKSRDDVSEPADNITNEALSDVLKACTKPLNSDIFNGTIIHNLNGEQWKASQFGTAIARLGDGVQLDAHYIFPGESLGDVGVASTGVGICIVLESMRRGYARSGETIISTSDETKCCSGIVMNNLQGNQHAE